MTSFWLIRHGETVPEAKGRCYGSLDFELSEAGRVQMENVSNFLGTQSLTAIYASPRSRALDSARIIASTQSCAVEIVPEFSEMNFGDFEGLSYDEIDNRYPDLYRQWMETPTRIRFPGGETFSEMRLRVLTGFDTIHCARRNQTVAIVSHGGVNRILLAWALQIPDDHIFRMAQSYAAVNLVTVADQTPAVQLMNYRHFQS